MSERNECEHGQLARSCNICGYEEEITELQATIATLQAEVDSLNKRLYEPPRTWDEYKSRYESWVKQREGTSYVQSTGMNVIGAALREIEALQAQLDRLELVAKSLEQGDTFLAYALVEAMLEASNNG